MRHSFYRKKWSLPDLKPSLDLKQFCQDDLIATFLQARNINTSHEANYYLGSQKPSFSVPSQIPNLQKAVERIEKAIEKKQNIVIYGDYDVDGTTSTALLVSTLKILGANISFYIPNRFSEGYGLNSKAVIKIKSQRKAHLLITCDCGITNFEEVQLAQSLGLDVIITDHHSLPANLPPAIAVLNPKQLPADHPLHWLPGVGVVYKLAEELLNRHNLPEKIEPLLDFVALGMIADLAPLRAENRLLVLEGLKVLTKTERPGLKALLAECGCQLTDEESIGFAMAPRINAAGRLQDANQAVELFLTEDYAQAQLLAENLTSQNKERQELCEQIYLEALKKIEKEIDLSEMCVLMLKDDKWHHGVVGIVASRLVEKFHLPVLLAVEENGLVKGSARGIPAIDLFEEISKHADLLGKFGGHKAAAGFSLNAENWLTFCQKMQAELKKNLTSTDLEPILKIDAQLSNEQMTFDELDKIWNLAPFGMGFERPVFTLKENAQIIDIKPIGKGQEHSKLTLRIGQNNFEALQWRVGAHEFAEAKKLGKIQLAFTPSRKIFRGQESLQIEIKDWLIPSGGEELDLENSNYEIEDCRNAINNFDLTESLKHENNLIFAQGLSLISLESLNLEHKGGAEIIDTMSDFENRQFGENLIFWSIPLSVNSLKLSLKNLKSKPSKIVFCGQNLKQEVDLKTFLRNLVNVLKQKINNNPEKEFEISLPDLACELESLEETCLDALNILQESGILSFKKEAKNIKINLSGKPKKLKLNTQKLQASILAENKIKQNLIQTPIQNLIQ